MFQASTVALIALFPAIVYFVVRVGAMAYFHEKLQYQRKLIETVNVRGVRSK